MRWWPCWLHEMMTWFVTSWGDDFSDCELMTFLTSEGGDVVDIMSWQLFWLHKVMTLLTSSGDDFLFCFTSWQLCWLHKVMTLLTSQGEDAYTSQWHLVECSHAKLVVCEKWLSQCFAFANGLIDNAHSVMVRHAAGNLRHCVFLQCFYSLLHSDLVIRENKSFLLSYLWPAKCWAWFISLFLPSIVDKG